MNENDNNLAENNLDIQKSQTNLEVLKSDLENENKEIISEENSKQESENVENNTEEKISTEIKLEKKKPKSKTIIIVILALIIILIVLCITFIIYKNKNDNENESYNKDNNQQEIENNDSEESLNNPISTSDDNQEDIENEEKLEDTKSEVEEEEPTNREYTSGPLSSNGLEDLDLYFLQVENYKKNKAYSPLAIKTSLKMLEEASAGETKEQISKIIGKYNVPKYPNSKNMSFANALFIRDSYKEFINANYIDILKSSYNADVIYDSFNSTKNINDWVSKKTFNTIKDFIDNISYEDFVLLTTLSIDMEWKEKIHDGGLWTNYKHIDYNKYINDLDQGGFGSISFSTNENKYIPAGEIGAVANKYDIIKTLGEAKIRDIVSKDYQRWLDEGMPNSCGDESHDVKVFVDKYIEELKLNYGQFDKSTDFYFYTDNNVKVFAKDLKTYDDITLQYVGILPKKIELKEYISIINSSNINYIIKNLKPAEFSSFKEGIITEIEGFIPFFQIDYDLNLQNDLNRLGICDIFNNKANITSLTSKENHISSCVHKTKIDFSNDGIKAASAVGYYYGGAGECGYDYLFEVPVEKIDLIFDKPYLFIVRDKNTNEVWYIGTVYEPLASYPYDNSYD